MPHPGAIGQDITAFPAVWECEESHGIHHEMALLNPHGRAACVKEFTMSLMGWRRKFTATCLLLSLASFDVFAQELASIPIHSEEYGVASWYGAKYRGRKTASGERFDPADLTAAHPRLPMGTLVEVSRPTLGRSVVVRINDRGPGGGRILDLSEAAARRLALVADGAAEVSVRVIGAAGY